jgi:hypothetical protein
MPISRLENFLRSPKGTVIYVDPNSFDATDSFENRGDSATRPFKTIQRALIEASRFSYQLGFDNDLNDRTTILVSSGTHYIDNRPGLSITKSGNNAVYKKRRGADNWQVENLNEFTENSNFDIFDSTNDLYKFNSVEGGVILPRGTSIVGLDLRKTKIRPLYVPDPLEDTVDRSSIFKVTGNCYFTSFTFFDADVATGVYKDYTDSLVIGKFSHHKLTAFTYADGVNKVKLGLEQTDLTDLQMYYYKIANAYGIQSGRDIPNYPTNLEIEPIIDEYRIVGVLEENLIGISSIRSGNGAGGGVLNEITVTTKDLISNLDAPHNLAENTPILISGITVDPTSYNGSFIVRSVVGPNTFTYITPSIPSNKLPSQNSISNAIIKVESDSTSSSSPYIFNCSLRSSYGMCGLWADGDKADGFKSIVVAQFTGISLQKDDNAFLLYSKASNNYVKQNQLTASDPERPLHTNSSAIYDPKFENFHIRASNNSFIQCVSIFAIGFAKHFVTETGGDMSITNSNSNFGALALESYDFRNKSFDRDDVGYITHIIPPREVPQNELEVTWLPIDVNLTIDGSNKIYLYQYNDINVLPPSKIDGYRIGSKIGDTLNLILPTSSSEENSNTDVYSSPIYMQPKSANPNISSLKKYSIGGVNPSNGNITVSNHQFITGEKVRIFSEIGRMPDGLVSNSIYYAINTGSNTIKLAYNYNDALDGNEITGFGTNNIQGLTIVSYVSDKLPGEPGHPIQWDPSVNNWYIIAGNEIRDQLSSVNSKLGDSTQETYFSRIAETRTLEDRLYKVRYVIPKDYKNIREPSVGFVLQESKSVGVTVGSISLENNLSIFDKRNEKVISSISAGSISNNSQVVTVKTELPHKFLQGDTVFINNVKSTFNPAATGITSTFNGSYEVLSIIDSRTFTYRISGVSTNPGAFTNNTQIRNESTISSLPVVSREKYKNTLTVYKVDTIKPHIPGNNGQDGIYHLTLITSNVKTSENIGYGLSLKNYNQDVRNLYPQVDRDNFVPNPKEAVSYADHLIPGKVITNDKRFSITRESIGYLIQNNIGFGISNLVQSGLGNTTLTITTTVEHKLNSISEVNNFNISGSHPDGTYYGVPITKGGNETDAKCNYTITSNDIAYFEIIDGGSNFSVNNTIGIGSNSTATVSAIVDNVNSGLELGGFIQNEFNDIFRIKEIPNSNTVVVYTTTNLPTYVPNRNNRVPFGVLSSSGIQVSNFDFNDITTGIVTVTTSSEHGLSEGNNFKIIGSGQTSYDSDFIVNSVIGLTTFTFNIGQLNSIIEPTQGFIYKKIFQPNAKSTGRTGENLESRLNFIYDGITTSSINQISKNNTLIQFNDTRGFNRGDYIQINGEIMRIISPASGVDQNQFTVQRGMFGTTKIDIPANSRVYKIKLLPVELRRPSFMRASGHTFEYLGYGPGNYSTSIPQKQSRKLSDDEIIVSQSRELSGGTVVYSGMNDIGEFYNGATKVSAITGQQTTIKAPIITFTGDDADGSDDPSRMSGIFDNMLIRQKLTVEGGENGTESSIFYGPVRFQGNVTFAKEFELNTLTLNNKKFFVSTPNVELPSNEKIGTIAYAPSGDSYIGRIKVNNTNTPWRYWGLISKSSDRWNIEVDEIKAREITATESLTINGVKFTDTINKIDSLNLKSLRVTGVSTFLGPVYGRDNNGDGLLTGINLRQRVIIQNDNAITSGNAIYLQGTGRRIDVGINTNGDVPSLSFRREDTSGTLLNGNSIIDHYGTGKLIIQADDLGGSVELRNFVGSGSSVSTLSILPTTLNNGIVQIGKTTSGNGSDGAHLSILNGNNQGDAVLSWRCGSKPYWMAGVDTENSTSLDKNTWKLAITSGTATLPSFSPASFDSNNTVVAISTDRVISIRNGDVEVGLTSVTIRENVSIVNNSPTFLMRDSSNDNTYSLTNNSGDLTLGITTSLTSSTSEVMKLIRNTTTRRIEFFRIGTSSYNYPVTIEGNLGLGVNNPSFKLDVNGDVRISGIITGSAIRNSVNKIQESALDTKIPTEKAVVEYLNTNYAKAPKTGSFIILHVASSPGSALTGDNSVPDGYSPEGVSFTSYIPGSENLRNTIFTSVTEALREASNRYVPLGSEIIVSVHNNITAQEEGPLMISNSWTPVVVAAARGASSGIGITMTVGGTNSMITADTRFTQFDFPIISSGIIFQDINVNVGIGATSVSDVILTFNGGFGVAGRDMNINWYNCRNNNKLINATASYGEKIQFRVSIPLKDGPGKNYDIRTACYPAPTSSGVGNTSTHMSMVDQVGGLAGQGVDLIFDFKQAGYGDPIEDNNTLRFSFIHSFSSAVKLTMVGIGGRGNCTIASRIGPKVKWNFNNNNWDMSAFYNGFHERPNVCAEAFSILEPPTGTTASQFYNISNSTKSSINNENNQVKLKYGAKIWAKDYNSGPFNLYTYLRGKDSFDVNIIGLADSDADKRFDAQLYN